MKSSYRTLGRVAAAITALAIMSLACNLGDVFASLCTGPFVVTKVVDTNDGACTADDCSVREAVVMSNACPGTQTVHIPSGTYILTRAGVGEDVAATGDLDISDDVIINGVDNPVIDGNHADRVFEILAGKTATMNGLTIQNGYAQNGAGIRNHGILNLNDSIVQGNTASMAATGTGSSHRPPGLADQAAGGGGFANGGGILSEGDGSLTINTIQVINNSADQGAGIMVLANGVTSPTFSMDSPTLYGATVANNTASQSGGGLWLDNQVHTILHMFDIKNNVATNDRGAGIYNASILTMSQGKLTANTGGIYGGGIYNEPAGDITATEVYINSNVTRMGGGIYNKGPARFYQSGFGFNEANRGQGGAIYNFDSDAALTLENVTISSNTGLLGGGGIRNEGGSFQINFSTIAYNSNEGINGSGGGEMSVRNSIIAGHSGGNCAGTPPVSHGFNIDSANTCAFIEPSDLVNTDPLLIALAKNGGWSPTHALSTGSPALDSADPDRCIPQDERLVARPQGARCDRGGYEKSPTDIDPTAEPTLAPTATPTPAGPRHLTLIKNGNCRKGPGTAYDLVTSFATGKILEVQGQNEQGTWLLVLIPPNGPTCWLALSNGTPDGSLDGTPVNATPPLPDGPGAFRDVSKCDVRRQTFEVTLSWTLAPNTNGYHIYRSNTLIATLGANENSYTESPPLGHDFLYEIESFNAYGVSPRLQTTVSACKK